MAQPDVLTMAELARLLAAPDCRAIWERHFRGKAERDRLLLARFAYAGLRRSELLGLKWDDVDLARRLLNVRKAKGGRQWVVPIHPAHAPLFCHLLRDPRAPDRAERRSSRSIRGCMRRSAPVTWTEFTTHDDGPLIVGLRAGSGPPVLLLHGGPGLGFDYLRDLADELAEENDVAWYQQRGLAPSAAEGPYSVATDVDDARRVLDALGWDKAWVVGHSWGGQLALHVAKALPERLFGVLAVDPLGSVCDGRWPEFDEEIFRRTPEEVRARARELDSLTTEGAADDELALELMRLVWPAYFADPEQAPPMPELRMASECSAQMGQSILAELPVVEAGLPRIRVPVGFVHGSRSPMPVAASTDAANRIPGAWVDVVDGAGHFVWVETPGAVRASLRRLTAVRPAPFS